MVGSGAALSAIRFLCAPLMSVMSECRLAAGERSKTVREAPHHPALSATGRWSVLVDHPKLAANQNEPASLKQARSRERP